MVWMLHEYPCPNCGVCPCDDAENHPEGGVCRMPLGAGPDSPSVAVEYRKTATILAVRINEPFVVKTLEGVMRGNPGDWLAQGVKGERWPIAADVFERSYVPATEPEVPPEIARLADFLLKHHADEVGAGNPREGESAVDVAIRLLSAR